MAGLIFRIGGSISEFAAKLRGDDSSDKAIIPRVSDADLLAELQKKPNLTDDVSVDLSSHQYTGTLGALNAELDISTLGHAGTVVFEVSGVWKGKIVVEGAVDGNYNNLSIVQPGGAIAFTGINNDNQNGIYRALIIAGYTRLRIRMSAYTSGTASVIANTAQLIPTAFVWQLNQANLLATVYQGGTWTNNDFGLMVARGLISGISQINKFGSSPNGVQTTSTDIWSRADSTPTQQIWLAPTAARIHAIVSSSVQDLPGGTGASAVIVRGLRTWDSDEFTETVTLNGTNPVNTANSYVIIHRMKAVAQATTTSVGVNAGSITATAAVDGTITAVIIAGDGQTEMAIYGVPSTQKLYMTRWSAALDRAVGAAASVSFQLRVNENPNIQTLAFIRKDDIATLSTANNRGEHNYDPPLIFPGPCIIKVQGIASVADVDAESAFDAYLVNN